MTAEIIEFPKPFIAPEVRYQQEVQSGFEALQRAHKGRQKREDMKIARAMVTQFRLCRYETPEQTLERQDRELASMCGVTYNKVKGLDTEGKIALILSHPRTGRPCISERQAQEFAHGLMEAVQRRIVDWNASAGAPGW